MWFPLPAFVLPSALLRAGRILGLMSYFLYYWDSFYQNAGINWTSLLHGKVRMVMECQQSLEFFNCFRLWSIKTLRPLYRSEIYIQSGGSSMFLENYWHQFLYILCSRQSNVSSWNISKLDGLGSRLITELCIIIITERLHVFRTAPSVQFSNQKTSYLILFGKKHSRLWISAYIEWVTVGASISWL